MPYADKNAQRAAQREWVRRSRASTVNESRTDSGIVEPLLSRSFRFEHAQDVLDLLARHTRAVEEAPTSDELMKARVIVQLASTALRALEACDLADRVDALEMAMKSQRQTTAR